MFSTSKKYKTPSGMGGVFSLKFLRKENGIYVFRITNPDWEKEITFSEETISKVTQDGD